ncbi:DUF6484 domain-containing protein [Sorangium sp. So ce131]|uniref:DUF6484 domain-containing protein n=1 Tax=Sorangium sp. So ce131 TaxID=3133282 RepID=UPI003F61C299
MLLAEHAAKAAPALPERLDGVLVGRVAALDPEGAGATVTFAGGPPEGLPARAMVSLDAADVGREVALMFEGGSPRRPIVMGRMVSPALAGSAQAPVADADGKRIEIVAEQEIVLRCGDASITLTRAGKILLRGAYVLSRSSGVNRIQGGSVQIN